MIVVKIHKDRGYGDGMFLVVREDHREYVLKPIGGGAQFNLYKAHTYQDLETKRVGFEMRKARAQKIGRQAKRG